MTNGWVCVNGTAVVNVKIAIALFVFCRSQMLTHAIEFIELSGPNFASKVSANSMLQQGVSGHKNPYETCDIYRIPPNERGEGQAPPPTPPAGLRPCTQYAGKPPSYHPSGLPPLPQGPNPVIYPFRLTPPTKGATN